MPKRQATRKTPRSSGQNRINDKSCEIPKCDLEHQLKQRTPSLNLVVSLLQKTDSYTRQKGRPEFHVYCWKRNEPIVIRSIEEIAHLTNPTHGGTWITKAKPGLTIRLFLKKRRHIFNPKQTLQNTRDWHEEERRATIAWAQLNLLHVIS